MQFYIREKQFLNKQNDEAKIMQFVKENRNGAARVWTWIKNTLRHVTGKSEKTFLEKAEKLYAAAFKAAGNVQGTENSGKAQYMATDARGNVVSDNATPEIVQRKLQDIFDGKYKGKTATIPVLQHTPQVFLDYCKIDGDRTFVMAASKAYNAMKNNTEKQHALGVEGLMEVIENLHTPEYIVFQRSGKNAGHYVAIVTANEGETVAAVDIGDYRSENNAVDGENGFYNVLITAFPADSDYIDSIIESEDNDIVYDRSVDKEYEAPVYVAASDTLMDVQTDASDKTVPQPAPSVKTEFSFSPTADADYMTAVENGDTATAQRMVDEAAKAAGYNIKAYHGTSSKGFTVFDDRKQRYGLFGTGFYFTQDMDVANSYTKKGEGDKPGVYDVYLKAEKPLDMDADANLEEWRIAAETVGEPPELEGNSLTWNELLEYAEKKGEIESGYRTHFTNEEMFEGLKSL